MRPTRIIIMLLLMIMGVVGAKAETVNVSLNPTTNGTFSNGAFVSGYYTTWTSNTTSGVEGLTITTNGNLGMCQQNVNVNVNGYGNLLAFKTTTANSAENITFTAPTGYLIKGYSMTARLYSSSADAYVIVKTTGDSQAYSGNASPISFSETVTSTSSITIQLVDTKGVSSNYLCVTSLTIDLEEENASEGIYTVVTLNNTNDRGALIYYPAGSEKWVWTNGKSGSFSPTSENCQWALVTTGVEGEYYLYNLGAKKFISPISGGTFQSQVPNLTWAFTTAATPVKFVEQSDGTFYIVTVGTMPGIFSNGIYASVSTSYNGPIISYYGSGDEGLPFTKTEIGKTTTKQDEQIAEALAKTINPDDALSDVASIYDGWYAIRNNTNTTATALAGNYVKPFDEEYNYNGTNYPLTVKTPFARPGIDEAEYYFRIQKNGSNFYWQIPNGRYLVMNGNKFPVSSSDASDISITYNNGFVFSGSGWYAVPWNVNANYFFGETSIAGSASYDIYPISLTDAGLVAWQVLCNNAAETTKITCTRSDVSGLTSVYKNGYFFLPTDVTPKSSDFSMPGGQSYDVNAENKTVTIEYDPSLAITVEGVTVYQGYGTTGLGNEKAVLLRMQVAPFNAMENAVMTFTLTNPDNISAVKVIETGNNVEFNSISSYTNTFEGTISNGTATIAIGSVSADTHYYWLCATVANDATVGEDIDAALTGMTYDYNGYTGTTCDLSAVGDPANSMKIFDVQSYPFYPGQEISGTTSAVYRIPAVASVEMPNGTTRIFSAVDKRYNSYTDIGGGHVIDIVVRYSDDGGKTWSTPVTIAKGDNSNDATCGYGDPSFTIGADGKIFCLFAAGNTGFFYGLNRIVMCTSEDYGETWTGPSVIAPASDSATGITFTDHAGLYDYFVTSGKGLYTSDGVLMYLLDAQTASGGTETNYLFYSTDEGATWHVDDNVVATEANEAKLVELEPGKLLSSTRSAYSRIFNEGSYTKNSDGTCTFTWGTQRTESLLTQNGSGNNQDVIVYNRNADLSAKVLLHTITSGNGHKMLKLFMSIDQGTSWNEVMQVQPGGSRYAVMTVLPNGDLGILFEDYSLETGNQYPINFLTVKKEQIEEWYEELDEAVNSPLVKNSLQGSTTGCDSWGSFSNGSGWFSTWTSNDASGKAGVVVVAPGNDFAYATVYSQRVMAMRPSSDGATDDITITAPEGFYIDSYTIGGRNYSGYQSYKLTAPDGTEVSTTTGAVNSITVENVNSPSSTFQFYGSSTTNYLCITNFTIQLKSRYPVALNVVGEKSYATLYLPFDVTTDTDTKAYYVSAAADGIATLTELADGNIPANTAVVLINDAAATKAMFDMTTGVETVVTEETNLLKGTLKAMTLDLGQDTPYYSMGRKDGKIGFYKFNNNGTTTITLGANKAYLDTSATSQGKGFAFSFGDPTGIGQVETEISRQKTDAVYNLSGQRVSRLTKGIYIVNGKKVVVK